MPEGPGLPRVTISCSEIVTLPGYVAYAMPLVALNFSLLEDVDVGKAAAAAAAATAQGAAWYTQS
jgi:hypothetical protein